MNQDWHRKHPMPRNPTVDERVHWHKEHSKACGCRGIPPSVKAAMARKRR
jgi:hypothetical protein